jgi:integrase
MPAALRVFQPERSADRHPATLHVQHLQAVIDLYTENLLARRRADDYSEDAMEKALGELHRFGAEFGQLELGAARQHDLTRWLGMNPQWRAASTKKRIVSTILGAFNWAEEEELIARSPYHWPRCLKGQADKARRPADPGEYVALMRFGSRPLRRALFFLRRTGARTKEMRELMFAELHLDGIAPFIEMAKHKTRRKTGKPKRIGLDVATANFLRALQRNQRGKTERVFTNCDGEPWDRHTFAQHLRRYAERLGIDDGVEERVSGYSFRRSFVCCGITGGVTTRRIADAVGHSSTAVIDKCYGASTRESVEHLGDVATEILNKRKKTKKPAKGDAPRGDGFYQADLFQAD